MPDFEDFGVIQTNGVVPKKESSIPSAAFRKSICMDCKTHYPLSAAQVMSIIEELDSHERVSLVRKENIFPPLHGDNREEYTTSQRLFFEHIRSLLPSEYKPDEEEVSRLARRLGENETRAECMMFSGYLLLLKGIEIRLHSFIQDGNRSEADLSEILEKYHKSSLALIFSNVDAYLSGDEKALKLHEFGAFINATGLIKSLGNSGIFYPQKFMPYYLSAKEPELKSKRMSGNKGKGKEEPVDKGVGVVKMVSMREVPDTYCREGVVYRKFKRQIEAFELKALLAGGEFGNYVSQSIRKDFANMVYDGFQDIKRHLGFDIASITRQELSFSLGSRAERHIKSFYDPKDVIISMPKSGSGGNFANSLFAYLDNRLGNIHFAETERGRGDFDTNFTMIADNLDGTQSASSFIDIGEGGALGVLMDDSCKNTPLYSLANLQVELKQIAMLAAYKKPDPEKYDRALYLKNALFNQSKKNKLSKDDRKLYSKELMSLERDMVKTRLYRHCEILDRQSKNLYHFRKPEYLCSTVLEMHLLDKMSSADHSNNFLVSNEKKGAFFEVVDPYYGSLESVYPYPDEYDIKETRKLAESIFGDLSKSASCLSEAIALHRATENINPQKNKPDSKSKHFSPSLF